MSLISDSFPEERRGKPIALYSSAISVGSALAALLGAAVLTWANASDGLALPVVGALEPWQIAFLTVGLPGLLLAVLFFFVSEPRRIDPVDSARGSQSRAHVPARRPPSRRLPDLRLDLLRDDHHRLQPRLAGVTFARTYGWAVEDYAIANGIALIIIGPISVNFAGWLSDRYTARGHRDAPLKIAVLGLVIGLPPCVVDRSWTTPGSPSDS